MKIELNPNYAYDLSELNDSELMLCFYTLKKDVNYNKQQLFHESWFRKYSKNSHFTYFDLYDYWGFMDKIENNKQVINAKTLFENKTESEVEVFNPEKHYDNKERKFRSLFELSSVLELNDYEFDILKRLVRCRKKGEFAKDIQKIKNTCDIYLNEFKD